MAQLRAGAQCRAGPARHQLLTLRDRDLVIVQVMQDQQRRVQPAGERDWFYFINGKLADRGATEVRLHKGDVEWWDYRQWSNAAQVQKP